MKITKRMAALLLTMTILLGCGIGGTLAWLWDETEQVANIFTVGKVQVDLEETTGTEYKMIPGHTNAKDPKVTVDKDSEDCFVFIKVVETNNTISDLADVDGIADSEGKVLLYTIDPAWVPLTGEVGVYYQKVYKKDLGASGWSDYILTGSKDAGNENGYVLVNENVTKEMMESMETKNPAITFFAAAVQLYKTNGREFAPQEAFEQLPEDFGTIAATP